MIKLKQLNSEYSERMIAFNKLNFPTDFWKAEDRKDLLGETRESNKAMQAVFEKCGYRLDRIEEKYYQAPDESAYKYILELK